MNEAQGMSVAALPSAALGWPVGSVAAVYGPLLQRTRLGHFWVLQDCEERGDGRVAGCWKAYSVLDVPVTSLERQLHGWQGMFK